MNRHKKEGEQFPLLQSLYGLYLCTFTDSGTDTGKAFVNDCVTDLQTYGNTQDVYRQVRKGRLLMGKSVGYARVSSREQNLARQVEALRQYVSEDMIVTDKASGKDFDRAGYQSLKVGIGKLVSGDTLYIKSLDRLGRNKEQAKKELQYFTDIGVRVKVLDLPTTMADISEGQEWILSMINNILIEVLTSISENERQTIKQRQAEGIAVMPIDKATGKRKSSRTGRVVGRPEITYPENWSEVYTEWRQGKMTAVRAMELLKLKKSSFYKLVKRYEQN